MKVFAWQMLQRNSIKREIKRLELQVAQLAASLNKRTPQAHFFRFRRRPQSKVIELEIKYIFFLMLMASYRQEDGPDEGVENSHGISFFIYMNEE